MEAIQTMPFSVVNERSVSAPRPLLSETSTTLPVPEPLQSAKEKENLLEHAPQQVRAEEKREPVTEQKEDIQKNGVDVEIEAQMVDTEDGLSDSFQRINYKGYFESLYSEVQKGELTISDLQMKKLVLKIDSMMLRFLAAITRTNDPVNSRNRQDRIERSIQNNEARIVVIDSVIAAAQGNHAPINELRTAEKRKGENIAKKQAVIQGEESPRKPVEIMSMSKKLEIPREVSRSSRPSLPAQYQPQRTISVGSYGVSAKI
jgi:hypothetical protein